MAVVALAKADWRRPARFGWLTPSWSPRATGGSIFYVYLLISIADPERRYVGFTADLKQRVKSHNEGASVHTAKYRPWKLVSYFAFDDERRAREFEYYLKSGSGRAFANKRLWPAEKPRT